jgi:hypothetical protein
VEQLNEKSAVAVVATELSRSKNQQISGVDWRNQSRIAEKINPSPLPASGRTPGD